MSTVALKMTRGDRRMATGTVIGASLAGATLVFRAVCAPGAAGGITKTVGSGITLVDDHTYQVMFEPTDTLALNNVDQRLAISVTLTLSGGDGPYTIVDGSLRLLPKL